MTDTDKGVKAPEELFDAKRKSFSPEFKREAVRLLGSAHKPAADLAREIGDRRNLAATKGNARQVRGEGRQHPENEPFQLTGVRQALQ